MAYKNTTDSKKNWERLNPVLEKGEISIERETGMMKFGDGISLYSQLKFLKVKEKRCLSGFLTQVGTNSPTIEILENTVGDFVLARTSSGTYTITSIGNFTEKTVPNTVDKYEDPSGNILKLTRTSSDVMTLQTYAAINQEVLADGVLNKQFIHIEIYI